MKLLFDENLSPKLPGLLEPLFPDSVHVRDCGLRGLSDQDVWDYASANGFTIVSKDSDFQQRSFLFGHLKGYLASHRQLQPAATYPAYHDSRPRHPRTPCGPF